MQITLKAARVNAGLSRKAVAKMLGVHYQTLRRWEVGSAQPTSISKIKKLCEIYNVDIMDLKDVKK